MSVRYLVLLCILCLSAPAGAEIYRWTDAQGRVHFGEQPAPGATPVQVKPQVVERDAETRAREERLERFRDARQQEKAQAEQAAAEQRQKRDQLCRQLRQQQASIAKDRQYFSQDGNGERRYYRSDEIDAARRALDARIASQCG